MTVDELRQFRKYIRSELEQVHCALFTPSALPHWFTCMAPLAPVSKAAHSTVRYGFWKFEHFCLIKAGVTGDCVGIC